MSLSILEAIKSKFVQKQGDAKQQYDEFIDAIVDGKSHAQRDAEAKMLAAGKGISDVEADVAAKVELRRLIAEAERIPELQAEQQQARITLLRARKALDDWNRQSKLDEQEHAKAVIDADSEFQRAAAAVNAAIEIRNRLPSEHRPSSPLVREEAGELVNAS